jgi:hypothetical protein
VRYKKENSMNKIVLFIIGIALGIVLTFSISPIRTKIALCPECPEAIVCPEPIVCPECPKIECPEPIVCPDIKCPECPKIECPECPEPIVCPDVNDEYIRWYIETNEKDLLYQKHIKE